MTLGMDYLLWGMNPVGYHLTSLLLHTTSAVVFFFLARRLLTLATPSLGTRPRAHGVGGVCRPRVRDPSPARRIRRLGHRTARCALRALLSVDAPDVPAGLRAG